MLNGKKVGFGITASFCTLPDILEPLKRLNDMGADIYPVVSGNVYRHSSRFHDKDDFLLKLHEITGREAISSIAEAELFGPKTALDVFVIAPATGNTLAKLANGITDSPVLMATKATLRNLSPIVLAPFSNDALGMNGVNIMKLLNTKNIYFVPFGQNEPIKRPTSMTANLSLLSDAILCALNGKQLQPVLVAAH